MNMLYVIHYTVCADAAYAPLSLFIAAMNLINLNQVICKRVPVLCKQVEML